VQFELDALTNELKLIRLLAEPFMEAKSIQELDVAYWQLRQLPQDNDKSSWSIDTPLRTIRSPGTYAQDGQGGFTVRANIVTLWEITRTGRNVVMVRDNISTSVAITTEDTSAVETVIARWTMDIAAVASAPGCGLHFQVKESDRWFPKGFDVPRVPVFIPTLGAVLEFVLGELFQAEWTMRVRSHASASNWRATQRRAWDRWLSWQQEIVRSGTVSPWLDVKARGCAELDKY